MQPSRAVYDVCVRVSSRVHTLPAWLLTPLSPCVLCPVVRYAILLGMPANLGTDPKTKILSSVSIKKHFGLAAELDPLDAHAHLLLGRFAFEIANVSWFEKKAAAALFASLPENTFDEAYAHCIEAERLYKGMSPQNKHLLAQCCAKMSPARKDEARKWRDECIRMEPKTAEERQTIKDATKMKI